MTKHRLRGVLALAGLVAALMALAPAAGAAPADKPRLPGAAFGVSPATAGKPDGRTSLSPNVSPGATLTDQIAVVNYGRKPLVLRDYTSDATNAADGSFALQPAGARPRDVGTWVHLGGNGVVRLPGRTGTRAPYVIVPVSITIPRHASPGDHVGGVLVSLHGTAITTQGDRATLDQRVGVRVYVRVAGKIRPTLAVDNLSVSYTGPALLGNPFGDGAAKISYRVHNTGNVLLGAVQHVDITSWLGSTVHVGDLPLVPPLLPGSSVTVNRTVPGVFPGGRVSATVHLTPVVPGGATDPGVRPVDASTSLWALPWDLIVLILVVLAAAALALLRWRQLARNRPARSTNSHRPSKGRSASHRPNRRRPRNAPKRLGATS